MHPPAFDPRRRAFVASSALGVGSLLFASNAAMAAPGGTSRPGALPTSPTGRPGPELESPPPEPAAQRLGWAVAGLGEYALNYAIPMLARSRLSRLAGLVSGSPAKLKDVAARHGVPDGSLYGYDRMVELRSNDAVDVVYVITPNATHCELVVKALEAGKHVMCEKPMANSASECQRMIAAAKAADRRLMVAYRAHWEPNNVALKQRIVAGALGTVCFGSADHHRPLDPDNPADQWRMQKSLAGGGSLVDIGIYSFNGLLWLLGEDPVSVTGQMHSPKGDPRFAEVENVFTGQLEFASGKRATFSSGYTADRKRIDIWGDKAVGILDPATSYKGNRLVIGDSEHQEQVMPKDDSAQQFIGEIDHLSQAVLDGTPIATPGEMGLRDVRLIEALYASAASGRTVRLNPDMTAHR